MADKKRFQANDCRCRVKLHTGILTRRVNRLNTRLLREQRKSSDDARKQGEGGRKNIVRIDQEVKKIEKKMNDLQKILGAVSELTRCCSDGNPSNSAVNYLHTLKTSVMKSVRNVLNATCESTILGTAEVARTTTVGTKHRRADVERADVKRDADERGASKKLKTRHDDNGSSHTDKKANRSSSRNAETARTTTVGTKRGRADVERADVERDADERGASKKLKTRHDDNGSSHTDKKANRSSSRNAETARTTSVRAKRERDAAERPQWSKTRRDGGEGTRTVAATTEIANRSTTEIANRSMTEIANRSTTEIANRSTTEIAKTETTMDIERKTQFSVVVINEMNPYYQRGVFANVELFRFMARTIVHRLMRSSTLCPDDYVITWTLRQMMPERIITSEDDILTIIRPFI